MYLDIIQTRLDSDHLGLAAVAHRHHRAAVAAAAAAAAVAAEGEGRDVVGTSSSNNNAVEYIGQGVGGGLLGHLAVRHLLAHQQLAVDAVNVVVALQRLLLLVGEGQKWNPKKNRVC